MFRVAQLNSRLLVGHFGSTVVRDKTCEVSVMQFCVCVYVTEEMRAPPLQPAHLQHTHTHTHTHHTIQVKGSAQRATSFNDLDDDMIIQISRIVPLGCTNLSRLNRRAERLQLSGFQPLPVWVELENSTHIERWVNTSLLHLIDKMHIRLLFCSSMCLVRDPLSSHANKHCCLTPLLAHSLPCLGFLAGVGRF